jgi:hypothetical protein
MKLTRTHWTLIAAGAGTLAGLAARQATKKTWEHFVDDEAPSVKEAPDSKKLLAWVAVSAAVAAVASTSAKLAVHSMREDTDFDPPLKLLREARNGR